MVAVVLAMPGSAAAQSQANYQGDVTSNTYDQQAGSGPTPPDSGTPQDPLSYDCVAPSSGPAGCQNVGLTHAYYHNHAINFLYTANFYCDTAVASKATTGCEGGKNYTKLPPGAKSQDPVYVPVPLGFKPQQGLQCPTSGNCIDHPASMDLSALYPVLKPLLHLTSASQLNNAPLSAHSHVIYDRNNNLPEWWNVVIVPVTSQAGFDAVIQTNSESALTSILGKNGVYTSTVPTNAFLYFQSLTGTGTTAVNAMNQDVYQGAGGPPDAAAGQSWDPLKNDCTATGSSVPACNQQAIGLTKGTYDGKTANFLYSENYFCDKSVSAQSSNGCEAGAKYQKLPTGTPSSKYIDPLYIIVPLFSPAPSNLQCPTSGYCIDHPLTMDLTRLSSTLDPILGTTKSQLADAPASPHSHIVLSANNNQPEWWPVNVIGVTSQSAYDKITSSSDEYATAKSLAAQQAGATTPIPTNIFLWFQVLPGQSVPSGGVQTGGGSTAAVQHTGLIGTGAGLVAIAAIASVLVYRRRYTF